MFASCENDLKKIKEIASPEIEKPIERTTDVEMILSDSGYVKYKVLTPLLIDYQDPKLPYKEMPDGVSITVYDKQMNVMNTITSKYGRTRDGEKIIEMHKNVVCTNEKGDIFKSEELIYDRAMHKVYSSKPVQIITVDGNIINGTEFKSNESMYPYDIKQSTGIFNVNGDPLQQ